VDISKGGRMKNIEIIKTKINELFDGKKYKELTDKTGLSRYVLEQQVFNIYEREDYNTIRGRVKTYSYLFKVFGYKICIDDKEMFEYLTYLADKKIKVPSKDKSFYANIRRIRLKEFDKMTMPVLINILEYFNKTISIKEV